MGDAKHTPGTDLTQEQIEALVAVRGGADVYSWGMARALREVQEHHPELVAITAAMERPAPEKRQPYFGAILTRRGEQRVHPSVTTKQPPTIRCEHCREVFEQPFADFFYRDKNGPFGWRRWCKGCYSEAPSIVQRTAARAAIAKAVAPLQMCDCRDGICSSKATDGRTDGGQRCKAHLQDRVEPSHG